MALSRRLGSYGAYWGNDYNSSNALSQEQMELNATYIYRYLSAKGWTKNSIAAILGNMQHESAINPGRWEGNKVGTGPGYGLVQWTPYTKYTEWVGYLEDPSTMDNNLKRIIYEVENKIQWIATSTYDYSFEEFIHSEKTPYDLACAFAWNYERSAVVLWGANSKAEADTLTEEQKEANREALRQKRGGSANAWYEYLGGVPITPDTNKKENRYKFHLFNRRRKIYG